jgi:hypothetical protein
MASQEAQCSAGPAAHPAPSLTTASRFRITLAGGDEVIRTLRRDVEEAGRGEFDVTVKNIPELNSLLADLISGGALVASVVPERSALEQQFREAVGESQ